VEHESPPITPEVKTGVLRWVRKNSSFLLLVGAIIFLAAGSWNWMWGWAYLGLIAGVQVLTGLLLIPTNPELVVERSQVQSGTMRGDPLLAGLMGIAGPLGMGITAALDWRFSWSRDLPLWLHQMGLAVALFGGLFTLWAMLTNRFFASTVRIQAERGHTVISRGPYRLMRHPGYLGGVLFALGSPLLLGSLWAYIPSVVVVITTCVRTSREDLMLQNELAGYSEYARRVRWRLLPWIW
jgi:protein-S-isoprenylcysteine O-methyltransferase Ste14